MFHIYDTILYHIIQYHVIPCNIASNHTVSYNSIWYCIMSYCMILFRSCNIIRIGITYHAYISIFISINQVIWRKDTGFFFDNEIRRFIRSWYCIVFFCTCKLFSPVLNSPRQSCKIKKDSLKHWNLHSLKFHPLTTRAKGSKINRGQIFLCLQYICCFFK